MKIQTKEFQNILKLLKSGVAVKTIISQMNHFIFTPNQISVYNDKIFISHPFPHDFQCSVNASEFLNLVLSIGDPEFDLVLKDNQFLVTTESTRSGFAIFTEGELFSILEGLNKDYESLEWSKLPSDFLQGLSYCRFSVSRDSMKGVLSGIGISGDVVASSDDYRVTRYKLSDSVNGSFIIPLLAVEELLSVPIDKYVATDSWVHFVTENDVRFSARLIAGEYPDTSEYMNLEEESKVEIKFSSEVKTIVENLASVAEGDNMIEKKMEIVLENNKATFKTEKKGLFWAEKDCAIDYNKEKISFLVNPVFFHQVLEKDVIMRVFENQATFTSGNFFHLFSLPVA